MTSHKPLHPCPCCGYRTLESAIIGSWEICPVCYWENAEPEQPDLNGHDEDDFLRAQASLAAIGSSRADCLPLVRPPLPHETRDDSWQTLAERRLVLCQEIEQAIRCAFDSESIERCGVSLHQMNDVDNCIGSGPAWDAHRKLDPERHWWEVTDEKLAEFGQSLTFLDAAGYAFYIPAYLSFACRQLRQRVSRIDAVTEVINQEFGWMATSGMWHSLKAHPFDIAEHYSGLKPNQRQAIAGFLQVFAEVGIQDHRPTAREYLERYWAQYLPNRRE
jgi:hypothetical protein